ncbi:MAG: alpha/beta hydrolase [Actinomycetota bacterium]|nr:alpha/beta hydrolase [Actinomycetota bacterium]
MSRRDADAVHRCPTDRRAGRSGGHGGDAAHVVLVHGVGLDGSSFTGLATDLRRVGLVPTIVDRRGYDDRPPCGDLDVHVADLVAVLAGLDGCDGDVTVVGVSGGATLVLALALAGHHRLGRVVVHEPLLGPAAAEQHRNVTGAISSLGATPTAAAVTRFLRTLVTPTTWDGLDEAIRVRAVGRAATIAVEAPGFAAFAIEPDRLGRSPTPITWTVGRSSPAWRHRAAAVARDHGVAVVEIDGAHTPQLENAARYAATIAPAGARR